MGVSKGTEGSIFVVPQYSENAKGGLNAWDRYFIVNSKNQSLGSSLLQSLFLEIL